MKISLFLVLMCSLTSFRLFDFSGVCSEHCSIQFACIAAAFFKLIVSELESGYEESAGRAPNEIQNNHSSLSKTDEQFLSSCFDVSTEALTERRMKQLSNQLHLLQQMKKNPRN